MRSIEEIKQEMCTELMNDVHLQESYSFSEGSSFDDYFSKVSVESVLLYVVAFGIWTLEKLFASHRVDVEEYISRMKPHTLRWYQEKVKSYLYGLPLVSGSDVYDTEGVSDAELESRRVVKYASVTELGATLYVKVAGSAGGRPKKLGEDELSGLRSYISEVKEAGVRMDVVSDEGDYLRLELDVYYNPLLLTATGRSKRDDSSVVEDAVKGYIEQLPFNGEYRNNALVDAVQQVDGVEMVVLRSASQSVDGEDYSPIVAYHVPHAGYFAYDRDDKKTIYDIQYIPYV